MHNNIDYLSHLVKGDLGPSFNRTKQLATLLKKGFLFPYAGAVSVAITLLLRIPAGIWHWLIRMIMFFNAIIAMPSL